MTASTYLLDRGKQVLVNGELLKAVPLLEECYQVRLEHLKEEQETADALFILADTLRMMGEYARSCASAY